MSSNTKKSIIAGALVSSAGIFFSKLIGLLYSIPFNDILGSSVNVLYYGMTQTWYMYLLSVCQAGFPFAIASLVARYVSKGDYEISVCKKDKQSFDDIPRFCHDAFADYFFNTYCRNDD